jgi:hypothetical protein
MGNQSLTSSSPPPPLQAMPLQQKPMVQKSDDMFGDLFPKASAPTMSKPSQEQPSNQNTSQNKSALWNDLSGSLDLDNLLSTKPKQSLSINELKNKQGMSGMFFLSFFKEKVKDFTSNSNQLMYFRFKFVYVNS